ncbi:SusC/RagA family TonB-linked outer membrane protein [Flavitalea sp.]|nr:SusC/RagA family TonB-linked outer membrane protein [Flavitalea sp.]
MRKMLGIFLGLLLATTQLLAQNRTLSGKVTSSDGSPIPNVSVLVKGTNIGTTTTTDGSYSLSAPEGAKTLIFSSVGLIQQEISIGNKQTIDAALKTSDEALQEVVVVGYGTQRRGEFTGSVASVKGAVIAQKPVQSFEQALGGRAAGVQITVPNGVVNNPPVFRVRGTNSISLSSYPLIVIDGVPTYTGDIGGTNAPTNPLASINPNDIESIDIAKDAAATSIYGSRAANGVVFVTTKKGKAGKTKITYDGWASWSNPIRLVDVLDGAQYTAYKNQALRNSNLYNDNAADAVADMYFKQATGPNGQPVNTNWYDEVYRTGFSHNHSISVSGANESTSYYFGAGYTNQEGILKRNDFKRQNILFNVDSRLNKVLTVGGKIAFSNELNIANGPTGGLSGEGFTVAGLGRTAVVNSPNVSPYNNDGSYNIGSQYIGVQDNVGISQVGFYNPVPLLDLNRSDNENNHLQANIYVQVKPFSWLTLKSLYGVDNIYLDNESFQTPVHGDGRTAVGSATSSYTKPKTWLWTNTAQFNYDFNTVHSMSLLVGSEQQRRTSKGFGLNRQGLSDPQFDIIQAGYNLNNSSGLVFGENYMLSGFGRLNYNYDKRYYVSGNIRQDEYSGLGKKKGTFWGASLAWEVTNEKFWESTGLNNILSSLKVRGSYGKVGNIGGIGNYESYSTYTTSLYGGIPTLGLGAIGNPTLAWETSTKTDVGLSFGVLNDKITFDVAYYHNDIDNLILGVTQAPSTGLGSINSNVGRMYNKGLELVLNATPIESKDFSWTTSFNISFNKNEVTSLAPGLDELPFSTSGNELTNKTLPGYSLGQLFVVRTGGVDPATGRRIFYTKDGSPVLYQHYVAPGSGQFNWSNPDGTSHVPITQAADGIIYAPTQPKSYGGWDNTFRYKGFELNALITYQTGFYLYYGTQAGLRDQRYWNNEVGVLTAWQKPGDVSKFPKPYYNDNVSNGSTMPISENVVKGDFLKLRNLTLSYTLPAGLTKKVGMTNGRFYVSAQNLAMITNYPGSDPETSTNGGENSGQGVDRNNVANARILTVGLNVGF